MAAGGVRAALKSAALGELFDFLEHECRPVAAARVLVPPAHLGHGRVALGGRRVPVQPLPLRAEELAERIPRRQADADAVGTQPLDRWSAKILRLADAHARKAYGALWQGCKPPAGRYVGLESLRFSPHTLRSTTQE
jgi:hypothetical protein